MIVLSLFDGISCGQLALNKANIKYDKYYASEIDKYAIAITYNNFPNTIQLGNVSDWKTWNIKSPDLIIAGSPCQGFSNYGKKLNFDDSRSKLFFIFIDILRYYKPKYFMLENVKMKKEWSKIITDYISVKPIEINSSLVSAQDRKRLYWSNISNIIIPKDKKIILQNILTSNSKELEASKFGKYELIKNHTDIKDSNIIGYAIDIKGHDVLKRIYSIKGKAPTITANSGGNQEKKIALDNAKYRTLIPLECERLQTLPDNYTKWGINELEKKVKISKTQRYKTIGNGWTIDVIAHIFKNLK